MKTRIKELRARYDLTQEDLANKVDVRREIIGFLEKGKYNPSLKLVYKVSTALILKQQLMSCSSLMNRTLSKQEIMMEAKTKVWLAEDGKPIIGAGKVALLKAIDEERSLRKACAKMEISYKHAWNVLNKINERLGKDVVSTVRGGKNQGTFLTDEGRRLISEYEMNRKFINNAMEDEGSWQNIGLAISARNKIPGRVTSIEKEGLVSKVKMEIEPSALTSIITSEAVERLTIKEGDRVFAIIKSTEVLIGKETKRE